MTPQYKLLECATTKAYQNLNIEHFENSSLTKLEMYYQFLLGLPANMSFFLSIIRQLNKNFQIIQFYEKLKFYTFVNF